MKWLSILLALYLYGLSLWPCADAALPLKGQERAIVSTLSTNARTKTNHEHHDQCSPFCTCACCSTTIIDVPGFQYAPVKSTAYSPITQVTFHYIQLHWADPLSPIWQPPKL